MTARNFTPMFERLATKRRGRPAHASRSKKRRLRRKAAARATGRPHTETPKVEEEAAARAGGGSTRAPAGKNLAKDLAEGWRQAGEMRHFWIVTGAVFLVYLISMPRTVTLEDSGLFNMVCYYAGVGHPPGYPLYTLLCPIFAHLPGLTTAHGVNIFSALCGALTCGLIYRTTSLLLGNRACGYAAGLVCGLGSTFWSQSVIQEVYSPNAVLVAACLWFAVLFAHSRQHRHIYWFALFYGLALSNHWPLVALSSPMFLLAALPAWRELFDVIKGRGLPISAALLLIGLLPYVYMVQRSLGNPFINFYDPLDSFERIKHFISRSGYSGVDNAGGNLYDKLAYAKWLLIESATQYHWIAAALIGIGLVWQWWRLHWTACLALLAGFIGSTFLLVALLHFTYSELWRSVFRVYPLVSYTVLAVWCGVGAHALFSLANLWRRKAAVATAVAAAAAVAVSTAAANFKENYRVEDRWGWHYAEAVLKSLEPNAIIITWGDLHLPIMYARIVEKLRPDVDLYNGQALIFNNRLTPALTTREKKNEAMRKLVANTDRPVYFFEDMGDMPWGVEYYGLYKKVRRDWPKNQRAYALAPDLLSLVPHLNAVTETDSWTRRHKRNISKQMTHLLIRTRLQSKEAQAAWRQLNTTYEGIMSIVYTVLAHRDIEIDNKQLLKLLDGAREKLGDVDLSPAEEARYYDLRGTVLSLLREPGSVEQVIDSFEQSIGIYDEPDNPSIERVMQVYVQLDMRDKFDALDTRYPNVTHRSGDLKNRLKKKEWSWFMKRKDDAKKAEEKAELAQKKS